MTGSQIILYFVGGSLQFIVPDLHAEANAVWLPVSNTLAIAAVVSGKHSAAQWVLECAQ